MKNASSPQYQCRSYRSPRIYTTTLLTCTCRMSYPYDASAPTPYPAGPSALPGYGAPPPGYFRTAGAPAGPPVASSGAQYFTSPEQEAAGKYAQGQAAFNEQDEFNDPQGKYKLVMKGASWASAWFTHNTDVVSAL